MKKDFLEELGIDGETADKVISEGERELEALSLENGELKRQLSALEEELSAARMDFALDGELTRFGAKNNKAVKALLNMDGISLDGGKLTGLSEQLERLKEENGFLFGADAAPRVVAPSGSGRGKDFGFKFTGVRPKED